MGFRLLFVTTLFLAAPAFADTDAVSSLPAKPKSAAKSCLRSLVTGTLFTAILLTVPPVGMETVGYTTNAPHVGMGIFLDWESLEAKFSSDLREQWQRPREHPEIWMRMLAEEMAHGFNTMVEAGPIARPRMASEFVAGYYVPNTCKHKALITAAVLEHFGYRTEVRWGKVLLNKGDRGPEDPGTEAIHVWVYLPDTDQILDPTQGSLTSSAFYEREVRRAFRGDFRLYAKTIGLLSR